MGVVFVMVMHLSISPPPPPPPGPGGQSGEDRHPVLVLILIPGFLHGEPSKHGPVWVPRACWCHVVILEAERTARDGTGLPREYIIIQMGIGDRPIEVLSCQVLPPELPVICDPALPLIIPLTSDYHSLVSPELWSLLWKVGGQQGWDVVDRGVRGQWVVRALGKIIIQCTCGWKPIKCRSFF